MFGKIIMSERLFKSMLEEEYRRGFKDGATPLDEGKKAFMLKLGFIQVDDDFWIQNKMFYAAGDGYTWAFPTPEGSKGAQYMPFHERFFHKLSAREIAIQAQKAVDCRRKSEIK